jgi:hypothetical protein
MKDIQSPISCVTNVIAEKNETSELSMCHVMVFLSLKSYVFKNKGDYYKNLKTIHLCSKNILKTIL